MDRIFVNAANAGESSDQKDGRKSNDLSLG